MKRLFFRFQVQCFMIIVSLFTINQSLDAINAAKIDTQANTINSGTPTSNSSGCMVNPHNALVELSSAIPDQHRNDINASTWFQQDNDRYLIVGGSVTGGVSTRLYRLNEASGQLVAITNGFAGFSAQHGGAVNALATLKYSGKIYLAVGGTLNRQVSLRLYKFNKQAELFQEVEQAYDMQHLATVNDLCWHKSVNKTYLAIGGVTNAGICARLYAFDPSAQTAFIQVSAGIAGFSMQRAANISSVACMDISGATYIVMGGRTDAFGNQIAMYKFNIQTGIAEYLENALESQPGAIVNALTSFEVNNTPYIVVAHNKINNISMRLYRLNLNKNRLEEVFGAFDEQHGGDVNTVCMQQVCNEWYLMIAGVISQGVSTRVYHFDTLLGQFVNQTLTIDQPKSKIATLAAVEGSRGVYSVESGQFVAGTSSRVYKFNTVAATSDSCPCMLSVRADKLVAHEGNSITYYLTLANKSNRSLSNVAIRDSLPTELTYVRSVATHGSYNAGTGLWQIGTLSAHSIAKLSIEVRVNHSAPTTITNMASIISPASIVTNASCIISSGISTTIRSEHSSLTRDLCYSVSFDDALVQYDGAFDQQHGDSVHNVKWVSTNDQQYAMVGGFVVVDGSDISASLYFFDMINKTLTRSTNGFRGFDVQHDATIYSSSVVSIDGITYLVLGGDSDAGTSVRLYRWNIYTEMFEELQNALSSQQDSTINTVEWHQIGSSVYLVTGGVPVNDISESLYRFDINATYPLTLVSSGTAGFDTQHGSTVLRHRWITLGQDTYLAMAGSSDIDGSLLRLYKFDVGLEELITVESAFDVQPDAQAECLNWTHVGSDPYFATTYLLVGQDNNFGTTEHIFRFNHQMETFAHIDNAFDIQHGNDIHDILPITLGNCYYALAAGKYTDGVSMRMYQLDPMSEAFISLVVAEDDQHLADVNGISTLDINTDFMLLLGGDSDPDNIQTRLYSINQN